MKPRRSQFGPASYLFVVQRLSKVVAELKGDIRLAIESDLLQKWLETGILEEYIVFSV